ncbi:MAG: hypothetical protein HC822_18785 [Oscillochloris sp.]|nr:hypothetical protein [Oscillochloris sp.]
MAVLGSVIALGAALAFVAVSGLLFWGGWIMLQRELLRGFVSAAASPGERVLTVLLTVVPLIITACFSLLAAGRIALVAVGLG